ncbi:MAG TPA: trypsin-like peptidase domain-containing protein, partial [Gemmatimonadales bacterium]|nr:trypsin-like peptidase domain-containing protein [Gemmatimonadales bacterium]
MTIEVEGTCCVASGSGLLMTQTGLIATSARVLAGARQVRVRLSTGELFDAVGMVSYEPRRDLALILIPGVGLPSAPLANSDNVAVGQRVFAIGVPPGVGTTVTNARLSAVRTEDGVRWLQVSVRVSSSANGGPLVNEQGDVVGLVVAGARAEHFNAVLPINDVRGEAGRLAGNTPTPFFAMAYEETVYPRAGGPSAGDPPSGAAAGRARTTPDLDLDFRPLNGVVLVFEEEYAGHLRVRDSTGYFLALTQAGSL